LVRSHFSEWKNAERALQLVSTTLNCRAVQEACQKMLTILSHFTPDFSMAYWLKCGVKQIENLRI